MSCDIRLFIPQSILCLLQDYIFSRAAPAGKAGIAASYQIFSVLALSPDAPCPSRVCSCLSTVKSLSADRQPGLIQVEMPNFGNSQACRKIHTATAMTRIQMLSINASFFSYIRARLSPQSFHEPRHENRCEKRLKIT
jgi:hypothetical protein